MKAKILTCASLAVLLACNVYCMMLLAAERKNAEASLSALYPFAEKYEILKSNIKNNIEFNALTFPEHGYATFMALMLT